MKYVNEYLYFLDILKKTLREKSETQIKTMKDKSLEIVKLLESREGGYRMSYSLGRPVVFEIESSKMIIRCYLSYGFYVIRGYKITEEYNNEHLFFITTDKEVDDVWLNRGQVEYDEIISMLNFKISIEQRRNDRINN